MRKKLTKKCSKCGEVRLIDEFYTRKADGSKYPRCRHCMRQEKRESYARIHKVPDKLYRNETTGRLMEHSGYSTRIHWSTPMDEKRIRKELDSRPANAFEAYYAGALYGYLEKCKEIIEETITAINK